LTKGHEAVSRLPGKRKGGLTTTQKEMVQVANAAGYLTADRVTTWFSIVAKQPFLYPK